MASACARCANNAPERPVLFFVSDGLRQDLVERYARETAWNGHHRESPLPAMAALLKQGVSATGGGLLTQAPPNTGAGWYSLATGAWPGVTGSTNTSPRTRPSVRWSRVASTVRRSERCVGPPASG